MFELKFTPIVSTGAVVQCILKARPLGFRSSVLLWLLYSVLLIAIALPDGLDTNIGLGFDVLTPISDVLEPYRGDVTSYAQGGAQIAEYGWITEKWLINLWPPGPFLLRAALIKSGLDSHIVLGLLLVVCLTWAVFFSALTSFLSTKTSLIFSLLFPLTLLTFTLMRVNLLRVGSLGTNGQATALLAIGVVFLVWAYDAHRTKYAVAAGVAFAASAYFRTQTELLMSCLTLLLVFLAIVFVLVERKELFTQRWKMPDLRQILLALLRRELGRAVAILALTLVTFQLLCLPWRFYHLYNDDYINWIKSGYYWENQWQTKEQAHVILSGTGALASCYVNPTKCAEFANKTEEQRRELTLNGVYFKESVKTLLKHPVKWLAYKYPFSRDAWFHKSSGLKAENHFIFFGGITALLMLIYSYVFVGRTRMKVFVAGLIVTNLGFNFALFSLLHVEARYLFSMKFLMLLGLILAIIYFFQRKDPASVQAPQSNRLQADLQKFAAMTKWTRYTRLLGLRDAVILCLVYSALLTMIALPDGLDTNVYSGIDARTPILEILEPYQGDISSYVQGGVEIAEHGWLIDKSLAKLWPPGPFLLRAGLIKVGLDSHVVLALLLVACLTWAVFFSALTAFLSRKISLAASLLLPATLLLSSLMHSFMLRNGTLGADAQGTALLAIGVLFLLWSYDANRRNLAIIAGVALAASAYFRAQTELLMTAVALLLLALAILLVFVERKALFVRRWQVPEPRRVWAVLTGSHVGRAVSILILALVSFHVLCLPWRLYHLQNDGHIRWISADYYWKKQWRTKEDASAWFHAAGGLTPCYVNPKTCAKFADKSKKQRRILVRNGTYFKETVKTLLKHPVKWATYKFPFVRNSWLQSKSKLRTQNLIILYGGLIALIMMIYSYFAIGPTRMKLFVAGIMVTNIGFNAALFTLLHTEERYLYPMKFLMLFSLILAIAYFRQREEPERARASDPGGGHGGPAQQAIRETNGEAGPPGSSASPA